MSNEGRPHLPQSGDPVPEHAKLVSFEGAVRNRQRETMAMLFDLEERVGQAFGRLAMYTPNSNRDAIVAMDDLRTTIQEFSEFALRAASIPMAEYQAFVTKRIQPSNS